MQYVNLNELLVGGIPNSKHPHLLINYMCCCHAFFLFSKRGPFEASSIIAWASLARGSQLGATPWKKGTTSRFFLHGASATAATWSMRDVGYQGSLQWLYCNPQKSLETTLKNWRNRGTSREGQTLPVNL